MIQDIDELIQAIVRRDALNGSGVEIALDAPTKEWVARRNAPTVDLYLYDIREDLQRRDVTWYDERNTAGIVTGRRPGLRRFRFSYLVTAWTQRPEDEHSLLSALLGAFLRNPAIAPEKLPGTLAGGTIPVQLSVGLPPGADRSIADVWTALGGELKPSLDVVILAPVPIQLTLPVGPAVTEAPSLTISGARGVGPQSPRGRRRNVPAAGVRPEEAAEAPSPDEQNETIYANRDHAKGRVIRVRGLARR